MGGKNLDVFMVMEFMEHDLRELMEAMDRFLTIAEVGTQLLLTGDFHSLDAFKHRPSSFNANWKYMSWLQHITDVQKVR